MIVLVRQSPGTPALVGVLCFLALSGAPAVHATLFSDDEARQGVADLQSRLETLDRKQRSLEEQVSRMESALKDYPEVVVRIENLTQDLAQLRGSIDALGHQVEQVDKRSHELYQDLDARLKLMEQALAPVAAGAPGAVNSSSSTPANPNAIVPQVSLRPNPNSGAEGEVSPLYDKGLNQFNQGDFANSLKQFKTFIKAHPKDSKVPSALYWIGANQLSLKEYQAARLTNQTIYKNHPDSPKAPDALLNLAAACAALGDQAAAHAALKLLVTKYPNSGAAAKAKKRLVNH